MKKLLFLLIFTFSISNINAQKSNCNDLIEYVKSKSFGTTFYSYDSEAIRKVSFYSIIGKNFKTYYFAIVTFTSSNKEYIYQVGLNTEFNYSMNYMESAGKAFWKYIQPYNDVLKCAPNFR